MICHPPVMNIRICDPKSFFMINVRCSMFIAVLHIIYVSVIPVICG